MQTKFIFVTGGVMSGLGKGVVSASISKLLQLSDQKVSCVKIDPYLNFDAGTMNPIAHGEVFVTEDGGECDMDIGSYERFLNQDIPNLIISQLLKFIPVLLMPNERENIWVHVFRLFHISQMR